MTRWTEKQVQQLKEEGRKKKTVHPVTSANALTKQVLRVLQLKNYHCWRQNNGSVYDPVKKIFRKGSATPGIPDVLAFHKRTGLVLAAEIKSGKDKLSKEQEAFLNAINEAGGIGVVIRNSDDIVKLEKEL